MRIFFALLLLTNILFALFQWLVPYERLMQHPEPVLAAQTLQLLDEVDAPASSNKTPIAASGKPARAPAIPDRLCYTLGPFKEQQKANEVALKFKQNKIRISSRSSQEKEYMGMMVYVGGHKTRAEAIATAESLAAKGIRDYIIVNLPEQHHIISLGVFSLKKNADRRLSNIATLGYQVEAEPRYRDRTIYWLDYTESENENLTLFIDQLKIEQGISRIARQCT